MKPIRGCLLVLVFVALSALAACAPEEPSPPSEPSAMETTAQRTTGNVALTTTPESTSGGTAAGEGTLGSTDSPAVVLRLEGGEGTRFSGICGTGGGESVLSGEVPRRFTFENPGEFSCRIQKQDEGSGVLRVILISGDTTRSVQQTNAPGGTIEVSFSG